MKGLTLVVRTPRGAVVDASVDWILAEDRTGWFGIRPGREDVIAVLPPGLLVYGAGDDEGFVALSRGLLDLEDGVCRVLAPRADVSSDLDEIAGTVAEQRARRRSSSRVHRGLMGDLAREALRRVVRREAR